MRKLFTATMLALALSTSGLAGDVEVPGKTNPPPPCTENCTSSSTTNITTTEVTIEEQIESALLELARAIIRL